MQKFARSVQRLKESPKNLVISFGLAGVEDAAAAKISYWLSSAVRAANGLA